MTDVRGFQAPRTVYDLGLAPRGVRAHCPSAGRWRVRKGQGVMGWGRVMLAVSVALIGVDVAYADVPSTTPDEVPCEALARGETRTFDMRDAPLADIVRVVACALDRNMLLPPSLLAGRTVTFLAPKAVDRRGLLAAWHAMLLQNQLTEERRGGFFVIRPLR
jgi:hypothetical protein